jgi:alpha-ketoglutarate-dependent 2,4-dichlorophenoxyacetate dioxygenase
MLLAHELPSNGGDTGFCDVRRAYADLSEEKKAEIADLVVEHE